MAKKSNTTKTNVTIETKFEKYNELYDALLKCETKKQLVDTMNMYGLRTTTTPTTTPNKNDLYIQFIDKSRVLFTTKSLKLYTNDDTATKFNDMVFDKVNDGSYRTKRATVSNTIENFIKLFSYFLTDDNNYLPIATK